MPAVALPLGRFARLTIRNKLLAMALLPLAGTLPLLGVILLWWSSEAFDRMLITKVRSDLAVAQGYFERTLAEVGAKTSTVAESHQLQLAIAAGHGAPSGEPLDLQTLERRHILAVLDSVGGDKTRAAQLLGISRRTLERRFAEWHE